MQTLVAIATCSQFPDLDPDGNVFRAALESRGVQVRPVVWDAPHAAPALLADCDAVVLRSTWDYQERPAEFLAWCRSVGVTLHNPYGLVAWNLDKTYLSSLHDGGLPTVPSTFVTSVGAPLPAGAFVVKPTVSAGSRDTAVYDGARHDPARRHIARLLAQGRTVLLQPYLDRVDVDGETALVFIDGQFAHAMRKGPLLELDAPVEEGLHKPEQMSRRDPDADVLRLGCDVMAWVAAAHGTPLYARVDVLRDDLGAPVVLELELIEPSLFLEFDPAVGGLLADALLARLSPPPPPRRAGPR